MATLATEYYDGRFIAVASPGDVDFITMGMIKLWKDWLYEIVSREFDGLVVDLAWREPHNQEAQEHLSQLIGYLKALQKPTQFCGVTSTGWGHLDIAISPTLDDAIRKVAACSSDLPRRTVLARRDDENSRMLTVTSPDLITLTMIEQFGFELMAAAESPPQGGLVLALPVWYLSSAAIGKLLRAHATLPESEVPLLTIVCPADDVREVFSTTHLDQMFRVVKSLDPPSEAVLQSA